jgi:hypothetical protein
MQDMTSKTIILFDEFCNGLWLVDLKRPDGAKQNCDGQKRAQNFQLRPEYRSICAVKLAMAQLVLWWVTWEYWVL